MIRDHGIDDTGSWDDDTRSCDDDTGSCDDDTGSWDDDTRSWDDDTWRHCETATTRIPLEVASIIALISEPFFEGPFPVPYISSTMHLREVECLIIAIIDSSSNPGASFKTITCDVNFLLTLKGPLGCGSTSSLCTSIKAPKVARGGKLGESNALSPMLFTLTALLARSNLSLKHKHTSGNSNEETANITDTLF